MDPLSVSASAVALITVCVQTVQKIKKTIETIKAAKRELMGIVNEIDLTRRLLEQLRGLTHQLGSRNIPIFLDFDRRDCESILGEFQHLVDKLAEAGKFIGFQYLVKKSKFEALSERLRVQRSTIETVLLSITTESAVFTREFVQTVIDGTNVQAVSMSSIVQGFVKSASVQPPEPADHDEPPQYTEKSSEKANVVLKSSLEAESDSGEKTSMSNIKARPQILEIDEDTPAKTDSNSLSVVTTLLHAGINLGTLSPDMKNDYRSPQSSTQTRTPPEERKMDDLSTAVPYVTKNPPDTAIWHGQLSRSFYDDKELTIRDQLADASFYGFWDDVESIIDEALAHGLRSLSNCYRLRDSNPISGWTPLHQAAYLSAPRHVVKMLIDRGASRNLQTIWALPEELPYKNMTALEIARHLGSKHLFDILSPVIHHHVPYLTLFKVQQNFHDLIRDDLADRPEYARLRLPELDLLTELENPEMFFPFESQKSAMGYFYRLDGRELLVASVGVLTPRGQTYYRITDRSVREIEDAVLFDMS